MLFSILPGTHCHRLWQRNPIVGKVCTCARHIHRLDTQWSGHCILAQPVCCDDVDCLSGLCGSIWYFFKASKSSLAGLKSSFSPPWYVVPNCQIILAQVLSSFTSTRQWWALGVGRSDFILCVEVTDESECRVRDQEWRMVGSADE